MVSPSLQSAPEPPALAPPYVGKHQNMYARYGQFLGFRRPVTYMQVLEGLSGKSKA